MFDDQLVEDEALALKEGPQYLLFMLHGALFGLNAAFVSEIVELPIITKIPWMHPSVRGVCNIRGGVLGVIDLGHRLHERANTQSQKSSLIIVNMEFEQKSHRVGLIVDEVLEIEVFDESALQKAPSFGLSVESKFVERMAHYDTSYIPILNLESVVAFDELSKVEEMTWKM